MGENRRRSWMFRGTVNANCSTAALAGIMARTAA
jgi:hypothetical protein